CSLVDDFRKLRQMVIPPSHEYMLPVMKAASSDARNTTSGAISSAFARRPIGWRATNILRASTGSGNALIRSPSDGVSTVPGPIALQRTPRVTKSAATALVSPMTAAFDAPYAKRLGRPFTLDAIDAMLMMLAPVPVVSNFVSIFGSVERMVTYIARTFRLKLNSQSLGSQSRIVPL